ncbi:MAG: hypothetical protein JWO02_2565 [Solirubrobacterales bacterium]|nr:hypothetical protein [Solirubrobacterales bacterium]
MSPLPSSFMRPRAHAASLLAAAVLIAGCGGTGGQTTTSARTTSTAAAATGTSPSIGQGQGAVGGPGSESDIPDATGAPAAAGIGSTSATGVIRPFSASSPWNTTVTNLQVDPRSAGWLDKAKTRRGVEETANTVRVRPRTVQEGLFINTKEWTTPVVDEVGGVPTRVVCRQLPPYCGDGTRVASLLIPPNEDPLPQYDGWFTVLNRRQGVAYDLWRARRGGENGDVMSYQFMRKWDLNGPGYQAPDQVSARGSGLPLFAGLILPEEIKAGRIDHALAISLPGPAQRKYVPPASSTDGVGALNSLPEGARVRLKSSVSLEFDMCPKTIRPTTRCFTSRTNQRAAQAIYTALRRYGAIVVDRSRVPTLYAKLTNRWDSVLKDRNGRLLNSNGRLLSRFLRRLPNAGTPLLRGSEVQQLHIDDFEVVRVPGSLLNFPDLKTTSTSNTRGVAPQGQTFSGGIP